jgi:hypothetical protein
VDIVGLNVVTVPAQSSLLLARMDHRVRPSAGPLMNSAMSINWIWMMMGFIDSSTHPARYRR